MATLAFSSSKYDARPGRAEMVADLLKSGYEFTVLKPIRRKVKFKHVVIAGKIVNLNNTAAIVNALKTKESIQMVDFAGESHSISVIDKSGVFSGAGSKGFNAGDVAEGIFALALATRFINKDGDIDVKDIISVKKHLKRIGGGGSKSELKLKSENSNSKVKDTISVNINLAPTNLDALFLDDIFVIMKDITAAAIHFCNSARVSDWAILFYNNNQENEIKIMSDGIGNQKGTKLDVSVHVSDKDGNPINVNLNVSLKAGDVKQFGQIGGSEFEKQLKLWNMFGVNVKSIENKYNLLLATDMNAALNLSYNTAVDLFNKMKQEDSAAVIKNAIIKQMIGDEDIILVQLNKVSTTYNPKDLVFSGKITAMLKVKSKWPIVEFHSEKGLILQVRAKVENNTYVRNYTEKGPKLHNHLITGHI